MVDEHGLGEARYYKEKYKLMIHIVVKLENPLNTER